METSNKEIAAQTEFSAPNVARPIEKAKRTKLFIAIAAVSLIIVVGISFTVFLRNRQAKNNLGQILVDANRETKLGNYTKSAELYAKAQKVLPKDSDINAAVIQSIALQGNINGQEGKAFQEASPYIDQALKNSPNDLNTLISVGYAYETAGKYDQALEFYDKALKVDPQSSSALFHKGHVLQFLEENVSAYEYYQKSYKSNPSDPLVLTVLANRLFAEQNYQQAYEQYIKASEIKNADLPIRSDALVGASNSKRAMGDVITSFELSKEAVDLAPDSASALGTYGFDLALNGQQPQGISFLKKAIAANSRMSKNYYFISQIYRAMKDYPTSISYEKKAVDAIANDNTILGQDNKTNTKARYEYDLAKTYALAGSSAEAIASLKSAISLNPTMKNALISDNNKYVFFKSLQANNEFLNLIN